MIRVAVRSGRLFVFVVLSVLFVLVLGAAVTPALATVGYPAAQPLSSTVEQDSAAQTQQPAITEASLSGEGYIDSQYRIVQDHPGPAFVWQSGELNVSVNITAGDLNGQFAVCGEAHSDGSEPVNLSDCTVTEMQTGEATTVDLSFESWPAGAHGNYTIMLELRAEGYGDEYTVSEHAGDVYVIQREGDLTGDGLSNIEEVRAGTDFTVPDTSGNGLTDWEEVQKWGTDPLAEDTTGDGVDDATLVRFGLDPTEPYVAHKYGLVLALFFVTTVTGLVVGVHRLYTGAPVASAFVASEPGQQTSSAAQNGDDTGLDTVPDESILTREEYVCQLLERNNDRMRQRQIVEITGWSKAKVSRVLSDLEEEGQIRKIQVGRENVIELSGEEGTQDARV